MPWRTIRISTSSCCTRPFPARRLFHQMTEEGRMLDGVNLADIHGQHQFNFRHAAISREDSKRWLDWAFRRDFERNGPSIYRICRTTLEGWRRYKNDPDPRSKRASPGKLVRWLMATWRRFGPWRSTFAAPIRQ
jgi:hypothetical protein